MVPERGTVPVGGESATEPVRTRPEFAPGEVPATTPTVDSYNRRQVPLAGSYRSGDPVWVHQRDDQGWHPGVVQGASKLAVVVRYWPAGARGQLVDTVMPVYVLPREADPELDEEGQS